jgi:Terminase large subunit, T4likevirus-type, N-terminal
MSTTLTTLQRDLQKIRERIEARKQHAGGPLARLRADPACILADAGMAPDPWQAELLRCTADRVLLLCSRQAGKSMTAAAEALRTALLEPPALILLLSPTQRQSAEIFRAKFLELYRPWRKVVPPLRETALTLDLNNGSRVISLPESEGGIRCYSSVSLLVIDEASRVADDLYRAVRPMLAVSHGRLMALSTPFGMRGWFHEEWTSARMWERVRVTASQCPRIDAAFLDEERQSLGERWFRQEYLCSFESCVDQVFSEETIQKMFSTDFKSKLGGVQA